MFAEELNECDCCVKADADDEEEMESEEIVLILIVNVRPAELIDILEVNMDSMAS